jgi:hypothetical protein
MKYSMWLRPCNKEETMGYRTETEKELKKVLSGKSEGGGIIRAIKAFLLRAARFLSDPHEELGHYDVARMTREEWEEYEQARFEEDCEKGGGEMTVAQIVKDYLENHGYDGLFCEMPFEGNCGCSKDDLFPCGRIFELCQPAYKHKDGNFYLEKEE